MKKPTRTPLAKAYLDHWRRNHIAVSGVFELTPRCTLDCKMCYVHLTKEQMGERRELSTETWLRIIDEAVENGLLYALLTGGECMLHEGFREIFLHLMNAGVVVSVNTNGLLLTDDTVEFFRQHRPNVIRVTLYGASDDGYERCTGHRAFHTIARNIDHLIAAGMRPIIAVTLSKYCSDEAVEILRFARDRGLPTTLDVGMMQPEEGTGRSASDFVMTPEEVVDVLTRIRLSYGNPLYHNPPLTELPGRREDAVPVRGLRCTAGLSKYVIRWDGMMQSCFQAGGSYDVVNNGFKACWEAILPDRSAELIPFECVKCPLQDVCAPCYLYRRDPRDPIHCNPAVCAVTAAKYNAGLTTLAPHEKTDEPASAAEDC